MAHPEDADRPGLLGSEELDVRVLVARGLRPPARGLAGLRVQAAGSPRQGQAVAPARGPGEELPRGVDAASRRGTPDGQRARWRQEGRHLVGLVREQGRGRMVTRHRAARLPEAPGLSARLRPGRARYSFPPVGPGVVGRGMRRPPRGCRRALAGRGDRGRPGTVPRHAARRGAPRVGVHRVRRGPGGGVEGAGVRPSGGTGGPERPRRDAERPALAVRLADLVPGTPRATVRAAPPSRGVYAEGCASTATSPCRCWAAPASSGWSTPGARTTWCSQRMYLSSIPARPSTWRGP